MRRLLIPHISSRIINNSRAVHYSRPSSVRPSISRFFLTAMPRPSPPFRVRVTSISTLTRFCISALLVASAVGSSSSSAASESSSEDESSSEASISSSNNEKQPDNCLRVAPYVMDTTSSGAVVRWESDKKLTARLCYKRKHSSSLADGDASWSVSDSDSIKRRLHSVRVSGLKPDTLYEYKVLSRDLDCESEQSLPHCGVSTRSSGLGIYSAEGDPPLRFRCRAEYLRHRLVVDDMEHEEFTQEEVSLLATLPEACDGEVPVLDSDLPHPEPEDATTRGERFMLNRVGSDDSCDRIVLEFRTAPQRGACGRRFRSWWIADSGTGGSKQRRIRDSAMEYMAEDWDATFAMGDNAYEAGTMRDYRTKFFQPYCAQLSRVPLFPTAGNHEARTSDSFEMTGPHFDLFEPGLPDVSAYKSHYSYQHGRVHVVMLDLSYSEWLVDGEDSELFTWLDSDLDSARSSGTVDWILVANHFPPYSKGSHDSDKVMRLAKIREKVLPIIERHGTDVFLSGHSHSYERSHLLHGHYGDSKDFSSDKHIVQKADNDDSSSGGGDDDDDDDNDAVTVFHKTRCGDSGTVYVVTGSSAKLGRVRGRHPAHQVVEREYCSFVMEIQGPTLTAACVGQGGELVDRFAISKDMDPDGGCPAGKAFGPSCAAHDGIDDDDDDTNPTTAAPMPTANPEQRVPVLVSAKSCAELGFNYDLYGSRSVCGDSKWKPHRDFCPGPVDVASAMDWCESVGSRLCTLQELANQETRDTGCGMNKEMIWSSTVCAAYDQIGFMVALGRDGSGARCYPRHMAMTAFVRCCADA